MAKIEVFKVPLPPATKAALDRFADHQGMPQVTVPSRLCEWFAGEDPSLQHIILGLCPPDCTAEVATLLLRRRRQAGEP
jgi:hypothetical protein